MEGTRILFLGAINAGRIKLKKEMIVPVLQSIFCMCVCRIMFYVSWK